MQVVGKRHYGLKALPQGGGGGRQITRELFDTLLFWKARVPLDEKGEAYVEIPLNDSLTGFRIVAVTNGSLGLFGTGETSVRTTQDLMVLSGIPPLVREGDKFKAGFTVRNASDRKMDIEVKGMIKDNKQLPIINESLKPGEAKEVGWGINAPYGTDSMTYEVTAKDKDSGARDNLKFTEKLVEEVPTRVFQATLTQVEKGFSVDIEKPKDSIPGKGGINVSLKPKLSNGLEGVRWYMERYPYICMEQRISRAVALRDEALWKKIMAEMPSYLDSDGLAKYFPKMDFGSDVLTSYILSISSEARYEIPSDIKNQMMYGLTGFIEGRVIRYSSLPTTDLSIRKMAALDALSRSGKGSAHLLSSISVEPNLWPTSAVIDWMNVLLRIKDISNRDKKLKEAEAGLLSQVNVCIVAVSTSRGAIFNSKGLDIKQLRRLAVETGSRMVELYPDAERIDRAALLELPVDLLCPCARHNSVHIGNAERVRACIICAGANNPVTPEAERILLSRGVLCLPDFITNSGGVLGGTMEFASVDRIGIGAFIESYIGPRIARLLGEADRQGVSPRDIAVPLAMRRFDQVCQNFCHSTLGGQFFEVGLELYRRGLIPGRLVASLSLPYFKRLLA